jgi:site-specific recombinase XerD
MLSGEYFSPSEISSLVRETHAPLRCVVSAHAVANVIQLGNAHANNSIGHTTVENRLRTIAKYLEWLTQEGIRKAAPEGAHDKVRARDEMIACLRAQIPTTKSRNVLGRREAPPPEVIAKMFSVIEPDSEDNPWRDIGIRVRNKLLVYIIYNLGMRRGEALSIKIEHIDFRMKELIVARSADDPEDPRKYQPLAKTCDRLLPFGDELEDMLSYYILNIRWKIKHARKHKFLFVAHDSGLPLTLVTLNKVFCSINKKIPEFRGRIR